LGIIAGIIVGVIVVAIVESLGHMIFPPPEGNLKDPEFLKSIMHEIPVAAKFAILLAWGLGVTAGGVVARLMTRGFLPASWIVGLVLFAGAAYTMFIIPHPRWMQINSIVFTIIGALLANRLVPTRRFSKSP